MVLDLVAGDLHGPGGKAIKHIGVVRVRAVGERQRTGRTLGYQFSLRIAAAGTCRRLKTCSISVTKSRGPQRKKVPSFIFKCLRRSSSPMRPVSPLTSNSETRVKVGT